MRGTGMAKYVPDIKTQRWVIISQSRANRPTDEGVAVQPEPYICPFCPGNEKLTPPEVFRIGSGVADSTGWQVRVVPNKFPITDIHEVIIHSPSCTLDLEKLPLEQVVRVFLAYRERYKVNEKLGQVLLFCNHGISAGASLKHPHSQLVVVPRQINLDAVSMEPIANIVEENTYFITYCPDFSQWPYEVWIAPKTGGKKFSDIRDEELTDLSGIVQKSLQKIETVLEDPAQPVKQQNEPFLYNFYIYHSINWFLRIIPRAINRAGFELGTGLSVNIVDPSDAAERLGNT